MAARRAKPFEDEGNDFQDVVICFAAIDHFAARSPRNDRRLDWARGYRGEAAAAS
jgi:hypothetical protein